MSACSFAAKKNANSETEVINNPKGKKNHRLRPGYVDKKVQQRLKSIGKVDVWTNMTVAELARNLKLGIGK